MSDFLITQDQINSLKNEVSIEERIQSQLVLIRTKFGRMHQKTASQELLRFKKDLLDQMKALETGRPYSPDFIESFKADFKRLTREILQATQEYALFELIVKLENLIEAMLCNVQQDRRRYPRFPLAIDLFLTLEGKTHTLLGIDISSVGLAFYAPVELAVGRRYTVFTKMSDGESLVVDVLRATRSEHERLDAWQTVCTFPNLVAWERIREIISCTMGNVS
jgi:hypothetical protein